MPAAMAKLLDLLGVEAGRRDFAALDNGAEAGRFEATAGLQPGNALPAPAPVFPRYVEPEAAK